MVDTRCFNNHGQPGIKGPLTAASRLEYGTS